MAEPTARIEPASSHREPQSNLPSRQGREKLRPKSKPRGDLADVAAPDELDEHEKHILDTLA